MMKHKPTEEAREKVEKYSQVGIPQEDIARALGIDAKTLRLHYREELDTAAIHANAAVGGALYSKAMEGDTAAMIWWSKARLRWSEKTEVESTGEINHTHEVSEQTAELFAKMKERHASSTD